MRLAFIFDLAPVQQARPRARRLGKGIMLYDPKPVKDFKKQLAALAREQLEDDYQPLAGALKVKIDFFRPVQSSLSKAERSLRLSDVHRPTVKPDLDNYIKSCLDGLNGIIWADDNQIVEIVTAKHYSDHPKIKLEVEELDN